MRTSAFSLACLALLAFAAPAFADWPAQGRLVLCVLQSQNGVGYARIVETPAGNLMAVAQGRGGAGAGWSVGCVTRDGDLAPGWSVSGVPFGATGFNLRLAGFAADDSNGFWLGRNSNGQLIARHALPDGVADPEWLGGSVGTYLDAATATGGSDVYFADLKDRVRRFTRAGIPAAGWPAAGRNLLPGVNGFIFSQPALLPDGSGGAVLFCLTADGPRAARVDAGSSPNAGWPAGGLALGPSTLDAFPPLDWPVRPLAPSGPAHFLAIWCDLPDGTSGVTRVLMQRFGVDGMLDPGWPAAGLQVVAPDSIANVTLVADGEGGAYVLWERSQRPFGTHVLSNGSFAGGLDDAGASLLPAGAPYLPPVANLRSLVADRGLGGGLVFVASEPRVQPSVVMRVRWLQPDLTPDPAVPDTGALVVEDGITAISGIQRAVLADGAGGVFLAWESHMGGATCIESRLAMTRVARPAVTGVPAVPGTAGLALGGAVPNPVRHAVALRFTLPDERPARLELFDVVGRRWRSVVVSGAGEHVQRFDDLGDLVAGLYLARLALGAESRTSRFVRLP